MIAFAPLRIDQDSLHILSVILELDILNLFDLDNPLKLMEIICFFIKFTIPELLLILFFLFSDFSGTLFLLCHFAPAQKTLLFVASLSIALLFLTLAFFLFLFLPPWHNNCEDRLSEIRELAKRGDVLLKQRHRVALGLEHKYFVLLIVSLGSSLNQSLFLVLLAAAKEPSKSLLTPSISLLSDLLLSASIILLKHLLITVDLFDKVVSGHATASSPNQTLIAVHRISEFFV